MPTIAFGTSFWRYVWFRSGATIAWGSGAVVGVLALLSLFPNMPLGARVLISFLGLLVLLGLMDVLTLSDRVETGDSAYPRQLFLLPASSSALAVLPLGGGAVLMAVFGLELGYGACARLTGYAQAWWAVPYFVAMLSVFSAIAWKSYPHSTIRLVVSLVGVALLLAAPVALATDLASPWQVGLAYGATIPFTVASAIHSVSLARRGDAARPWKLSNRVKARPAFRSPMEAQVWLEVKRNGIFGTFMVCFSVSMVAAIAAFTIPLRDQTMLINGTPMCSAAIGFSAAIVGITLLLMGLSGCCASPLDNVISSYELQPFLALRPLSTAQLVEAKMRMAAVVLVRCCALSLLAALVVLLIPSVANPGGRPTLFVLAQTVTWQQAALAGILYCAALLGTAKGMVSGIWSGIGRLSPLVRIVVTGALPLLLVVTFIGGPVYLYGNPALLPKVLAAVPYVAATLVVLKLGLAGLAVRRLREMTLVSDQTIVRWAGAWILIATILICALAPFRSILGLSLAGLALAQFLSLPFGRVALAPILVSANRHR